MVKRLRVSLSGNFLLFEVKNGDVIEEVSLNIDEDTVSELNLHQLPKFFHMTEAKNGMVFIFTDQDCPQDWG